ncbi:MAG TPA: hypothetical protein VF147_18440, partial [Vicinamibacterales bacterium]
MQRRAFVALLAIIAPLMCAATVGAQGSPDDQLASPKLRIEWAEFKKLYDAGKVVVIDVREAVSFEA